MSTATVWLHEDQLTHKHPRLRDEDAKSCVVLLIESRDWAEEIPHHKQKLTLVWSAMRHFAEELSERGFTVDYRELGSEKEALGLHIEEFDAEGLVMMETAEFGRGRTRAKMAEEAGLDVEVVANSMFLSNREEFNEWAAKRKTLRMEDFYRGMRRRTGLLMDGDEPVGGDWNYDKQNRETPDDGHEFPPVPHFRPDETTKTVMEMVEREFPDHFGALEEFGWPVTWKDARQFAADFMDRRLDCFGPYQDAIVVGEPALYHSLVSPLLNIGLLEPMWLCREAQERHERGSARLNSVEGFVRQILGWREYVYQVYWLKMPEYIERNALGADLPLPEFYWTADTDMYCVADAVRMLLKNGVNHHIQRLMVTGNFALIAGIDPQAVNEWYSLGYADAWEWVVTPNVIGMALYADGGVLGSKPYAASSNYINKMSNACGQCSYDRNKTVGDDACPFNSLYWDFIDRNSESFARNQRMGLVLKNWERRDGEKKQAIRKRAIGLRQKLASRERV